MIDFIKEKAGKHGEIIRFFISGGTAFLVSISTLYVLVDLAGLWYLLASAFSFLAAFIVSFTLQKFWTFRNRGLVQMHLQIIQSLLVATMNLGLNTLSMYLLVDKLGSHYLFAQVVTTAWIAVETFFLYKYFVFSQRIDRATV
jgi:putative flippase GtrA